MKDPGPPIPGLTELETRYAQLAAEEPPRMLDQAVLNLARRELDAGRQRKTSVLRWVGALSAASLLVITLSLVVQQRDEALTPADGSRRLDSAPAAPASAEHAVRNKVETVATPAESATAKQSGIAMAEQDMAAKSAGKERQSLDDVHMNPERWLRYIQQLQQDGLVAQAAAELQAFRDTYPDFPVPENLLD